MNRFIGFIILCFILVSASSFSVSQNTKDGKKLFTSIHQCNECHAASAEQIFAETHNSKDFGSDLSGFKTENGNMLASFLRKKTAMNGSRHKKEFKGTDEELKAIIDWLGSLEAQK